MSEELCFKMLRELFPCDYPGSPEYHEEMYYEQMAANNEPRWSYYGGWIN